MCYFDSCIIRYMFMSKNIENVIQGFPKVSSTIEHF